MKMKHVLLIAAALSLLVLSRSEAAETVRREATPPGPPPPFITPEMQQMMDQQIKRLVQGTLEEELRFLEQPENLARMARITRKYYEELKKAGFSDDEALRIVASTPVFRTGVKE